MDADFYNRWLPRGRFQSFLQRLDALYKEMDAAYDEVAQAYGFHCTGCRDNCCRTRFYHHTQLEYLYLHEGFCRMPVAQQKGVRQQAEAVLKNQSEAEVGGDAIRLSCPLHVDEKCILYRYRPMICRLHGLPHMLHRPGGSVLQGPGCDEFHRRFGEKITRRLDRTTLYRKMAQLESDLRRLSGCREKFKMTVARMILSFPMFPDSNHPVPESSVEEKHAKD
jgi:Fe-S-cluster containining protein